MRMIFLALALLPQVLGQSCKSLVIGKTSYTATLDQNVCIYNNVRFATPPVGDLRFAAPQPPTDSDPPAPTQPVSCIAMDPGAQCGGGLLGDLKCDLSPYKAGIQQEDCLFLDIYVPASITADKMPVVVWIYGGAFVFGSKQGFKLSSIPLYSGKGPLSHQVTPTIFVAINYRLGAYGWLAGDYMEAAGLPNAGLADQLAAMNFVSDNIGQLGGDGDAMTVWGESAGASSILHHLVSTETVPFKRVLLQSPAFQWLWDRKGSLNTTYTKFASLAGCPGGEIACLRASSASALQNANQLLWSGPQGPACAGMFPVGPAVDGKIIETLPPVALANGQMQNVDSMVISHVNLEVGPKSPFVPLPITQNPDDPSKVTDFLTLFMANNGAYSDLVQKIEGRYPVNSTLYKDQAGRAALIIKDSSFVCNTRDIIDAYSGKSSIYAMEYDFLSQNLFGNFAVHGTDLLPTFSNGTDYTDIIHQCTGAPTVVVRPYVTFMSTYLAPGMQSYFMSHAATGDPNQGGLDAWSQASIAPCSDQSQGTCVQDVLQTHYKNNPPTPFTYGNEDTQTPSSTCEFWRGITEQIMNIYDKQQSLREQDRTPLLVQEL